ncbi:GNAT family N-acetyltransferase [Streptomyces triticirhizae]|uniref:GNAT family N-acetyltransferase n=1 Tax=Streptomyces triticirhizae TaxID=2483353 RepID=A0A3M2M6U7_9ACTN|nr:GNAT family N-acetyltransferase [Streptomyces triticirhizae]RMI45242.1 GNAT family N-acetyltransferase [Streptomyces triticirhizae]
MTIELRRITAEEWDAWYDALEWAFGGVPEPPEERALWRELAVLDRSLGAFDGGEVVGTYGEFALGLAVPGGAVVETGGVTMVSVAGTHRRRGLLRRMMERGLAAARERGEALSALTAAEAPIYGRFGYGVAAHSLSARVPKHRVGVAAPPPGTDEVRLTVTTPAEALLRCEEVYAQLVPRRPGMLERRPGWERSVLLDPPGERGGASERRCVLAERDGRPVGYARYALKVEWDRAVPSGAVLVRDLDAVDPAAHAALLRYLLALDLTDRVELVGRPVDDPLVHLLSDVRRSDLQLRDRLHLRLVDVGAALAARRYAAGVDVVLAVRDAFCPWNEGRWRLSGGPGGAVCERTTDPAELELDVRALGAAYLGGSTLAALAAAGQVGEARAGALTPASTAFGHPVAPWLPHGF